MSDPIDREPTFEELFNASPETPEDDLVVGDDVTGTVVMINKESVFIDYGGKSEGWADRSEFFNEEDELTVAVGDEVTLKLVNYGRSGAQLGKTMRGRPGESGWRLLEDAQAADVSVEGVVSGTNKGGFEITVGGAKAFCPISQIDINYCEDPEVFVGQTLPFAVVEIDTSSHRAVLSRRRLLQQERDKLAVVTRERLEVGVDFEGVVTRLIPSGAIVDIGGLDGFVHVSEISREHVADPADRLKRGDNVSVRVTRIGTDDKGRDRIGLSMRALEPDPWEEGLGVQEGDRIRGIVRRLAAFGAFVEIMPGVDGLVPISEIAWERIGHPSEKLCENQNIEIEVMSVDYERQRISLSYKATLPPPAPVEHKVDDRETRSGNVIRRRTDRGSKAEVVEEAPVVDSRPPSDAWAEADAEANAKALSDAMDDSKEVATLKTPRIGVVTTGVVSAIMPYGMFIDLPECGAKARGLVHNSELGGVASNPQQGIQEGDSIEVEIVKIDELGRLGLSRKAVIERREREELARFQKDESRVKMNPLAAKLANLKLNK